MKLVFRAICLVALLVAAVCPAMAKDTPEQVLKSLPAGIKTFAAEDPHVYEEPGWGASIGYNDLSGVAVTVYLYDLGLNDIGDGIASQVLLDEKKEVIGGIENSGYWSDVLVTADDQQAIRLDNGKKVDVLFTQFSLNGTDPATGSPLALRSDLYLTGLNGFICKIRITRPASTPEAKEKEIASVVKELLSRLAVQH